MTVFQNPSRENLMKQLDILTKQRSYLAKTNRPFEYLSLEPQLKELIYLLFDDLADFYYAASLFDNSEVMAIHHYLTEASYYHKNALTLLHSLCGNCPYYDFMDAVGNARIAFYMEDYYTCIEESTKANNLWYTEEYVQVSIPSKKLPEYFSQTIDHIGTANVLLLCNAYGKINHPSDSIELLTTLLEAGAFDAEQTVSAEITLAQLYIINEQNLPAKAIYEKYKDSNLKDNPGLAAALAGIAYVFETSPSPFTEKLADPTYCYSHDMFVISRYNYALGLVSSSRYDEALSHFRCSGTYGYSMTLLLLAIQDQTSEIDALRETVNAYFYRQIQQIVTHYNEELAYHHLSKLQYHINLSLGAYCHPDLSARDAYDFLLNTKYISLETTWKDDLYSSSDIQKCLSEDTLLLEYTCIQNLHSTSYGIFVVNNSKIHYIALADTSSIDALIADWHSLLQESIQNTKETSSQLASRWQRLNSRLRRALYLPMKPYLTGYRRLILAPAGSLISFPFSRLSCSADSFLDDTYQISYLNTGKELCRTSSSISAKDALVIGNPKTSSFSDLRFAEAEADMVSYFLQTRAYKKEDATLANFHSALKCAPSVLHIAAHGICHPIPSNSSIRWNTLYDAMTNSGIILADDTLLSCTQIGRLDLTSVQLAVLSCCHSAQAAYLGTEGAYGLRRSLRSAGCHTIIASLWQVDDRVSFLWMKTFYEHLTICQDTIADAFSAATEYVKTYYQHPYYWSSFILISDQ